MNDDGTPRRESPVRKQTRPHSCCAWPTGAYMRCAHNAAENDHMRPARQTASPHTQCPSRGQRLDNPKHPNLEAGTTLSTVHHRTQYTACSFARSSPTPIVPPAAFPQILPSRSSVFASSFPPTCVPKNLSSQSPQAPPSPRERAHAWLQCNPRHALSPLSALSALSALSPDCPLSRKSGDREFCGAPPHECQ
jgi:hypothetical protein